MSRTMSKTEILTAVVDFFQKTGEGLKTSADIALKLAKVAVEVMDAMQSANQVKEETGLRAMPQQETIEILSKLRKEN
jgi:NTP pyrophosphatase (non-canonical NTP hydrolase)